jgi:hypothetical protein
MHCVYVIQIYFVCETDNIFCMQDRRNIKEWNKLHYEMLCMCYTPYLMTGCLIQRDVYWAPVQYARRELKCSVYSFMGFEVFIWLKIKVSFVALWQHVGTCCIHHQVVPWRWKKYCSISGEELWSNRAQVICYWFGGGNMKSLTELSD